jgi:serine/threonine protein phosphatase PrpC
MREILAGGVDEVAADFRNAAVAAGVEDNVSVVVVDLRALSV